MRKQHSKTIIAILLITLSALSACTGANNVPAVPQTTTAVELMIAQEQTETTTATTTSTTPVSTTLSVEEPLEIEMIRLVADYTSDPDAAAAVYEDRRLLVRNVPVTEVSELYKPVSTDMFISSQGFKFRTDYLDYVTQMEVGYVVDVEGVLEGPSWGFIVLKHCSYTIIDSSQGIARPDFQTTFG